MDESSLLDQPSDIDELEKAKAIESIVLSSSNNYSSTFDEDEVLSDTDVENEDLVEDEDGDGDADDDMNETDASMIQIADSSSIVTVTNSMYDESLKSTDAENGSESCMETKEMDLDSLDSERSTNIVATEPITQHTAVQRSNSPSPSITLPPPSQPGSVSPHQQPAAETKPSAPQEPLPIEKPIVSSTSSSSTVSTTATAKATATVTSSSSKSPPQQQTPNKLCYFVKFVPKASQSQSQPPTIVMQVPKSPPKTVLHVEPSKVTIISASIPSAEGKTVKTVDSDTSLEDEPTTSTVNNTAAPLPPPATAPAPGPPLSSSSKSIGHTVNLLNNNRILIKKNLYEKHRHHGHHRSNASASMKSTVTDSSDTTKTTASSDTNALNPISTQKKKEDAVDTKSDIALCGSVTENVKFDADGVDDVNTKCEPNSSDNSNTNTALEIKREQLLNENSMDGSTTDEEKEEEDAVDSKDTKHFVNDTTDANDSIAALATAIIEEKNSQTKIKREYQQLQKTVNQSKVLSEFVIEHNKRNRRPTKSGKSKHWKHNNKTSNPSVGVSVSGVDDSFEAKMDRCSSPSSVMSESDRSSVATCSSSVNYGATITAASTTAAGKRSTRSQNTDFSAKQKRFLKGIQQITRGTDDETDNQSDVADDDDDDDADYLSSKKQSHIAERRKSTFVKSFNLDTKVSERNS